MIRRRRRLLSLARENGSLYASIRTLILEEKDSSLLDASAMALAIRPGRENLRSSTPITIFAASEVGSGGATVPPTAGGV